MYLATLTASFDRASRRILGCVVRRLHNWSYRDVTLFLRENGFIFLKARKGSHQAWIRRGQNEEMDRVVEVAFTHHSYPLGTLKSMINQSGIKMEEWFKWGNS